MLKCFNCSIFEFLEHFIDDIMFYIIFYKEGVILVLIIILILIGVFIILKKTKRIKYNSLCVITGTLKSGKTALAVYLSIKEHKKAHLIWSIRKFFGKHDEEPLLYSNLPLKYKYYIPLTTDILLRKKRIAYKSIVLLSEVSLVADSQDIRDSEINESITLFCKTYAHMSHGGKIFIESQNLFDLHYAFKRIASNYVYIHSNIKLPFFMLYKVREMLYQYDEKGSNNVVNNVNEDAEKQFLKFLISKCVWKYYDRYALSVFTDDLDYDCALLTRKQVENLDLKVRDLATFKKFKYLKRDKEGVNNE